MKLIPIRLPGPNARKARAYAADIAQLRAQGYTFEAIREALAAAGIRVSNSTVQREAARADRHPPNAASPLAGGLIKVHTATPAAAPAQAAVASVDAPLPQAWHSGRDVAEAYTRDHIANPLLRPRGKR